MSPGSVRPASGSIVARARGWRGPLPPFMVIGGRLHQGKKAIAGEGAGPLGARYDPFRLEYDSEDSVVRIPALQLPAHLTPERLTDRRNLLRVLDQARSHVDDIRGIDDFRDQALAMLTAPQASRMFDLSQERPELADRYGRTRFGQSCLLARRLVEHGVPFVQVNWADHVEAEEDSGDGGWDHHYRNFQIMQDRHAMWLDRALSTFILDLEKRGLLASTLVLAVGEFGRSPKINDKAGREHHPNCYSALVAGGGVKGGRFVGTSDSKAAQPADTPLTPADLNATVLNAIGLTSEQITGLGLTPVGRVIEE